ncbi:hypothetical protein Scep_008395 [Stephania cephalantha]|uniref:Transmembrane protein n=1 Tax=Stephania cephalantha TaxID=152367 RepID=A0AAP0KBL1_9MAGN
MSSSSTVNSQISVVLATALAVSGATVILLAFNRHKALLVSLHREEKNNNNKNNNKKIKRVHFADDVIDNSNGIINGDQLMMRRGSRKKSSLRYNYDDHHRVVCNEMPKNHLALYSGILRDRRARMPGN